MIEEVKKILEPYTLLWEFEKDKIAKQIHQLYTKPDRPELEKKLQDKVVNMAVGMMIIAGKLKVEDLDEADKSRYEEICQLTYDQILALIPDIEQRVSMALEDNTLSIIGQAKREEREMITKDAEDCGAITKQGIDVIKMWNFWQALKGEE